MYLLLGSVFSALSTPLYILLFPPLYRLGGGGAGSKSKGTRAVSLTATRILPSSRPFVFFPCFRIKCMCNLTYTAQGDMHIDPMTDNRSNTTRHNGQKEDLFFPPCTRTHTYTHTHKDPMTDNRSNTTRHNGQKEDLRRFDAFVSLLALP